MRRIAGIMSVIASLIDMNDIMFLSGLALMWHGLKSVYGPAAPIVCGAIILLVACFGATRIAPPVKE